MNRMKKQIAEMRRQFKIARERLSLQRVRLLHWAIEVRPSSERGLAYIDWADEIEVKLKRIKRLDNALDGFQQAGEVALDSARQEVMG